MKQVIPQKKFVLISVLYGALLIACSSEVRVSDLNRAQANPDATTPIRDAETQADVAVIDVGVQPSPDTGMTNNTDAGMQVPPDTGSSARDASAARDTGTHDAGSNGIQFPGQLQNWCTGQPSNFSFFVTSMDALWVLSGSTPGDLRGGFGGDFQGLAGADTICQLIADATGNGNKTWRAFLSATDDGQGNRVHAIDRVGTGPWYDANGRQVASGINGLLGERPDGDPQSTDDLPDECGVPLSALGDAHDIVTASNRSGQLLDTDPETTCNDWTTSDINIGVTTINGRARGLVQCGHSFPRASGGPGGGSMGGNWVSDHGLRGCGKGANLIQNGPGTENCIGCSGGYGALYCFAQ
jgi:hypothetical protein